MDNKMDREALLIYLNDVRDLELAKVSMQYALNKKKKNYETRLHNLKTAKYVKVPDKIAMLPWSFNMFLLVLSATLIIFVEFVFFITLGVAEYISEKFENGIFSYVHKSFQFYLGCILLALGIFFFFTVVYPSISASMKKYKSNKKSIIDAIKFNDSEDQRIKDNIPICLEIEEEWNRESSNLNDELRKVISLLTEFYSLNILPNQYRSLEAVYYIYDYMSSSQAELESTLLHEHMENGIQRVLEKLDTIIEQNSKMLLKKRIAKARNHEVRDEKIKVLESLGREKIGRKEYILYMDILERCNKVNEYFSMLNV